MHKSNVFLKPNEGKFMALAVIHMLETLGSINPLLPWDPQSRKDQKDMISAGRSLSVKLAKLGFDMSELPPYMPGDENEFFTKES